MILEKDYGVFYWCKAQLTDTEFADFVKHLTEMKIADGADFETKEVCFKFAQARPKTIGDITRAKEINTQNCKKFLYEFSKKLDGRLYFNVNHKIIKKI